MAPDPAAVARLVDDLGARARPAAEAELEALTAFAKARGHAGPLRHWDVSFWSALQRLSNGSLWAAGVSLVAL